MKYFLIQLLFCVILTSGLARAQKPDVWKPLRFFSGEWKGTSTGQSGDGTVERIYEFILGGKYLQGKNTSTYAPQEMNPKGEVHYHWDMFSYDRTRRTFVLRQFHQEGFVNQYVLDTLASDSTTLVFTTEAIENIPSGWKARETYRILNQDSFEEIFELAEPRKKFEIYSRNRFTRTK